MQTQSTGKASPRKESLGLPPERTAGTGAAAPGASAAPRTAAAPPQAATTAPRALPGSAARHIAAVERARIASLGGVTSLIWLVVLVLMVWH